MPLATLAHEEDFDGWRAAARALAIAGVAPDAVVWAVGDAPGDLFAAAATPGTGDADRSFPVPRAFLDLARDAIAHGDPARFALLYAMLVRLRATPGLFQDRADPALRRLGRMAQEVRRDSHKMRAFLRFRAVATEDGRRFVAWFEPTHHSVRRNAAFFLDRFAAMRWSILTPRLSLHWDMATLREGPGATRAQVPQGDPLEETWKTYYAAIFNPARVKVGAMLKEMPRRYWKNMPETALVPGLIANARAQETAMLAASRADTARDADGDATHRPR